jgi:hypothetical protein
MNLVRKLASHEIRIKRGWDSQVNPKIPTIPMDRDRARELIEPIRNRTAKGISEQWRVRMLECLEYILEGEDE